MNENQNDQPIEEIREFADRYRLASITIQRALSSTTGNFRSNTVTG